MMKRASKLYFQFQLAPLHLGKPVDAVYESIDPVPLATASIAQVHAAVLRGSRKDVVVKVLKPNVTDTLKAGRCHRSLFTVIASSFGGYLPVLSRIKH